MDPLVLPFVYLGPQTGQPSPTTSQKAPRRPWTANGKPPNPQQALHHVAAQDADMPRLQFYCRIILKDIRSGQERQSSVSFARGTRVTWQVTKCHCHTNSEQSTAGRHMGC